MPEFVAGASDAGARLDVVLARHAGVSRALAARLIVGGAVSVAGAAAGKSLRVEGGMRIAYALPEEPGPPRPEEVPGVRIVFQDDHLLVISKPAGLVVHPAPGAPPTTLANFLVAHGARGGDPSRPGIVHRLDVGTSGLMIVARSEDAYERLVAAMSARRIERRYLALVEGSPDTETVTIDAPIGRSPQHRKKMAVVAGGRDAVTDVTVLERHAATALVEARPVTGRTHQIRVHLSEAGHAVVGDAVYGRDRKLARALDVDRPFLHAARLAFDHPITGARVELEDPLPPELEEALRRARG